MKATMMTVRRNRNASSRHTLFPTLFLGLSLITVSAWPMGEETFGNKPLSDRNYTDWPGITPLINDEHRVYSTWVNGNEYFYYRGDTEAFNQFLSLFAALNSPVHNVIFRPGPMSAHSFSSSNKKVIPVDWQMHLVGGIVAHMVDYEGTADLWDMHPTLTVYLTEKGRIQLDKVIVPEKVNVVQAADLRDKYRKALQSDHTRMHADAVTKLAEEDNLNAENIPLIAGVLKDNDAYARACAAFSLGCFGALAKSALPELEEASQSEDQQVSACAKESIEKITNGPDLTDDVERLRAMEECIRKFIEKLEMGGNGSLSPVESPPLFNSTGNEQKHKIVLLPGEVPLEMVWITAGEFMMGSPENEGGRSPDELQQHRVSIPQGFWLGKYEVTKRQWEVVMKTRPWSDQKYVLDDPSSPAVYVSFDDAHAFITEVNNYTGFVFRLPTEAEWEYATRAGTTTQFYWGENPDEAQVDLYAWWQGNSLDKNEAYAHLVGGKIPNAWGLYDMSGNVYEWCQDWYHDNYEGAPEDGSAWEVPVGHRRVIRGGDWGHSYLACRSASRESSVPWDQYKGTGFRLLRQLSVEQRK